MILTADNRLIELWATNWKQWRRIYRSSSRWKAFCLCAYLHSPWWLWRSECRVSEIFGNWTLGLWLLEITSTVYCVIWNFSPSLRDRRTGLASVHFTSVNICLNHDKWHLKLSQKEAKQDWFCILLLLCDSLCSTYYILSLWEGLADCGRHSMDSFWAALGTMYKSIIISNISFVLCFHFPCHLMYHIANIFVGGCRGFQKVTGPVLVRNAERF